jgi:hypothetical protein
VELPGYIEFHPALGAAAGPSVLGPRQIARVEITAARLAPEKMFGLTDALPIGALAEHRPRAVSVHRVT